jgi:hypothetical protein
MAKLLVTFKPLPIPWVIHRDVHGHQARPGEANVVLTVRAIDSETFDPVTGTVDSVTDPTAFVEDPNNLHFKTNEPRNLELIQWTAHDGPTHSVVFDFLGVKISADGYEDAFLSLDDRKRGGE